MSVRKGEIAPLFTLPDQRGIDFNLADHIGEKNILIYFYPKDETPGCIAESCGFRDKITEFENYDCKVIGISKDSIDSHAKFAQHHNLPFTILSDSENKVRKQYGVEAVVFGMFPGRKTYLINKQGIISHIFDYQIQARKHIVESLKALADESRRSNSN
jgi:thioredoxin-dependent peroxiredoxin